MAGKGYTREDGTVVKASSKYRGHTSARSATRSTPSVIGKAQAAVASSHRLSSPPVARRSMLKGNVRGRPVSIHGTSVSIGSRSYPEVRASSQARVVRLLGGNAPRTRTIAPGVISTGRRNWSNVPQPRNIDSWNPIKGKVLVAGGNSGGFYRGSRGQTFYVKKPGSELAARHEVVANRLYRMAGAQVVPVSLGTRKNSLVIFGQKLENVGPVTKGHVLKTPSVRRGVAVDAWLQNYDAALNNMIRSGSKTYRIDQGGALGFTSHGNRRGGGIGSVVTAGDVRQIGRFSPGVTAADLKAGVEGFKHIDRRAIMRASAGTLKWSEASNLAGTLLKRKAGLMRLTGVI